MRRRSGRVSPDRIEDRVVPDVRDRASSEVRHAAIQAPGLLAHGDQAVGGHREQTRLAAARKANDQLARARRLAQSEVEPRILRREVAAARLHLTDESAAVRERDRHARAWSEAGRAHLEPVSGRGSELQQLQPAADRVDRDVEPAVVVVVRDGDTATDDARQSDGADRCTGIRELPGRPLCGAILEHLDRLGVPGEVRDRNGAVGEYQVGVAVEVEVGPRRSPAGERLSEGGLETGPSVGERRAVLHRRQTCEHRVLLAA